MIRRTLLTLSRQKKIQEISANAPISRSVVSRFIAGEAEQDAVGVAGDLASEGLLSTIDHLGGTSRTVGRRTTPARPTCGC